MPLFFIILFSLITIGVSVYTLISKIRIFCKDEKAEKQFEEQMEEMFKNKK